MAKRKREAADGAAPAKALTSRNDEAAPAATKQHQQKSARKETPANKRNHRHAATATVSAPAREGAVETTTFQVVTGSYERTLHGFTAAIPHHLLAAAQPGDDPKVDFADTFLFNAHASAVRCLALSPQTDESSKIVLATGSTDERINLYSLSTAPPAPSKSKPQLPTLHGTTIAENTKNKELGSLLHHSSSITALYFPTRSKLLSSAEDSTIAITRTRDWIPLSTIKAPIPKAQGRPSGDTAAPGEVPSGINDFAVHPSMKLMVSVGKGEKCMRLWNLVTGKKAGVLNFGRDILSAVGEGRFGSGEGRRVVWDKHGDEFAVGFERGVVVFGVDCKPKAKILPTPRTKVHQMHYLQSEAHPNTLLVSTEDGRVLLYDTSSTTPSENPKDEVPSSNLVAQIGGPATGLTGRVKDFTVVNVPNATEENILIITGSSDGTVRFWGLDLMSVSGEEDAEKGKTGFTARQVGKLLGTYSTGTRITCLKAFPMTGTPEVEEEEDIEAEKSDSSSDDDDSE
ncbi:WD40 repeat-like protein [Corynespora cassiicola Philippines]|uniref:WD40 repeat-like protein n=1 Tax=Corynespora cassiicola Philippines TaxID=1448308 RepID=A0A2T2NJZ3_CORCC|nr:WD40 repeat-like protein [Corynespora cassiicola Philippines]